MSANDNGPPEATNEIKMYLHCGMCVAEWKAKIHGTEGTSPATYSRLSVGWTARGLQVWCERHDANVVHIDFEGQRHPANLCRSPAPREKH